MGSSHSSSNTNDSLDESIRTVDFTATGRRKKNSVLQRQNEFPLRIRTAIADANRRKSSPKIFLQQVERALADWLFEVALSNDVEDKDATDGACYGGPNDERDTESEVELALRFFPRVLCLRRYGLFPILWLSKSIRSVSFIPLFARLGHESGLFPEFERGGLVFGSNGMDVFSQLAATCNEDVDGLCKRSDLEQQEIVDAKFLEVIQKLRSFHLMTRKDIRTYKMIDILCNQSVFPEQRFRYLVDWDPRSLLSHHGKGKTLSMRLISHFFDKENISGFRMLFELSVKYYSVQLGFLFDTIYSLDDDKNVSSFRKKRNRNTNKKRPANTNTSKKRPVNMSANGNGNRNARRANNNNNNDLDKCSSHCKTEIEFENSTSLYQFACETYGTKEVTAIIDHILYVQSQTDENFTRKAMVCAATTTWSEPSNDGATEAMFLLLQRDPTMLQHALTQQQHSQKALRRRSCHARAA